LRVETLNWFICLYFCFLLLSLVCFVLYCHIAVVYIRTDSVIGHWLLSSECK
jgi:hypothetical protein